jgi:TatD DNase family protein
LHWFNGTRDEVKQALQLGCFFSINAEMLRTSSRKQILTFIPLDRIVTETDGPFTVSGGRQSRPEDARLVITMLANTMQRTEEEITIKVAENVKNIERM